MSEQEEKPATPAAMRWCANCHLWDRDWMPNVPQAQSTWGYCRIGLGDNQHMAGRMTTDMMICSGWIEKVEPPKS